MFSITKYMNPNVHPETSNNLSRSPSPITRLMRLALYLPRTTYHSTDFETLSRLYAQYFFYLLDEQQNYQRSPT